MSQQSTSGRDFLGPTTADEIIQEWIGIKVLSQRLADPLWSDGASGSELESLLSDDSARLADSLLSDEASLPEVDLLSSDDWLQPRELEGRFEKEECELEGRFEKEECESASENQSVPTRARSVSKLPRDTARPSAPRKYWRTLQWVLRIVYRRLLGIAYHTGADILADVEANTGPRVRSLMAVEKSLPTGADYGVLIGPACICLEGVIGELVQEITPRTAAELAGTLSVLGHRRQAELLRKWGEGTLPMTMGLQVTIFAAIERANSSLQEKIAFSLGLSPRYLGVVRSGNLVPLLEQVRTQYRNPSCHGARVYSRTEYAALARLLVTRDCMRSWYRLGPVELDAGLLDVHLLEYHNRILEWRRLFTSIE